MAEVPAPEGQINGAVTAAAPKPSEPVGSKRQRRPSVRLGEIGDQPSDSHTRRTTKPWRLNFPNAPSGNNNKPSKTRPLTNLTSASDFGETLETDDREGPNNNNNNNNTDGVVIGSWRVKDFKKRGSSSNSSKRPRSSNWVSSRIDEGDDDVNDGYYRDFDADNSESPIHYSTENLGDDEREAHAQQQHYHHQGHFRDRNNDGSCGEDGVRIWLNGLGLGRYAPVFQIHEVDDEVLPLLTLEDLKDMGINAVGSRRKMYCAIQKLGKGFS